MLLALSSHFSGSEDSLVHFCPDSGAFGVNVAEELIELLPSSLLFFFFKGLNMFNRFLKLSPYEKPYISDRVS